MLTRLLRLILILVGIYLVFRLVRNAIASFFGAGRSSDSGRVYRGRDSGQPGEKIDEQNVRDAKFKDLPNDRSGT